MPSKNTLKTYIENGYYHIYNRGVEKRRIFEESKDYERFLSYLKMYLSPVDSLRNEDPLLRLSIINSNLSDQIDLLAYCLMPNHFHLLIKQKSKDAMTKLMRQVTTGYSMYFNKKYERIGHLFQGRFKASMVDNDEYLLHLSRYIHQNPKERGIGLADFPWSSYSMYIFDNNFEWLKPKEILEYFKSNKNFTYRNFVENDIESDLSIKEFALE